eukprot:3824748-Rhodomonas_salina.1
MLHGGERWNSSSTSVEAFRQGMRAILHAAPDAWVSPSRRGIVCSCSKARFVASVELFLCNKSSAPSRSFCRRQSPDMAIAGVVTCLATLRRCVPYLAGHQDRGQRSSPPTLADSDAVRARCLLKDDSVSEAVLSIAVSSTVWVDASCAVDLIGRVGVADDASSSMQVAGGPRRALARPRHLTSAPSQRSTLPRLGLGLCLCIRADLQR